MDYHFRMEEVLYNQKSDFTLLKFKKFAIQPYIINLNGSLTSLPKINLKKSGQVKIGKSGAKILKSHYLLILLVLRSVHGPQAELWIKRYHFGFVYSCPPEKTLVCPILLTLSKMRRERRMRIFGALGPDFELSNTFFLEMCSKICQVATKQEITITIQNV